MSGWHPNQTDGGIPPNPGTPTSPAQAFTPATPPVDTDALYYGNGCDVRLRPAVLNTLISENLAVIDRVGLAYRPAVLTNLFTGIQYVVQKGLPKWVVLDPQASPVFMYLGTPNPPVLNDLNNGMVLAVLPTAANAGAVQINLGTGWRKVLRNDLGELEAGDWLANVPQPICFFDDTWYMLNRVRSQGARADQVPAGFRSGLIGQNDGALGNVQRRITFRSFVVSDSAGGSGLTLHGSVTTAISTVGVPGGIDILPGSLASQQFYEYVIAKADGSDPAGLLSLSSTSPVLPSGYALFGRVGGAAITDAFGVLFRIRQSNYECQYIQTQGTNTQILPIVARSNTRIGNGGQGPLPPWNLTWGVFPLAGMIPPTAVKGKFIITNMYGPSGYFACGAVAPNAVSGSSGNPAYIWVGNNGNQGDTKPVEFFLESSSVYVVSGGAAVNNQGQPSNPLNFAVLAVGWTETA